MKYPNSLAESFMHLNSYYLNAVLSEFTFQCSDLPRSEILLKGLNFEPKFRLTWKQKSIIPAKVSKNEKK